MKGKTSCLTDRNLKCSVFAWQQDRQHRLTIIARPANGLQLDRLTPLLAVEEDDIVQQTVTTLAALYRDVKHPKRVMCPSTLGLTEFLGAIRRCHVPIPNRGGAGHWS